MKTITQNTLFNAAGKSCQIIIGLLLTPFVVSHLGMDRFGIWAIAGVITGYFGLLDVGISGSYVKFISEYYANKDFLKINQVVTTGMTFYTVIAAIVIFTISPFIDFFLNLLHISPEFYKEAHFIISIGIPLFLAANILNVFHSVLIAAQRMDISNKISIAASLMNAIGTVTVLKAGFGLRGLMINNVIIFFLCTVLNFSAAVRVMPALAVRPSFINRKLFKDMFRFGINIQISGFADIITFQTDRLFTAYFFTVGMTGFYQLGTSITKKLRELPHLLLSAILPAACDLNAKGEPDKMIELYYKGSKYLNMFSIPLFLFTATSARLIMLCWMGAGYERSGHIVFILSIGYLISILSGAGCVIGQAISRPDIQMKSAIITAVANISLSVLFAKLFGFIGIAAATSLSFVLSCIYFFVRLHHELGCPLFQFFKKVTAAPLIASLGLCLFMYVSNNQFSLIKPQGGRLYHLALLLIEFFLFIAAYLFFLIKTKYILQNEFSALKKYFPVKR